MAVLSLTAMTGEIEILGEAVTAGLVGAAVEPEHGARSGGDAARCLNCGTPRVGSHCHHCGQKSHVHRSLAGIGHDLLHAILHFDGKFWNTLPLLVWRPGDLTRRYIHGERASFISPLALFLFAVFLTYAVLASVGMGSGTDIDVMAEADKQQAINGARTTLQAELDTVEAEIKAAKAKQQPVAALEEKRAQIVIGARALGFIEGDDAQPKISDSARRNFSIVDVDTGNPMIDEALRKVNANPGLLMYKLQANAYKFAWALIPLSMPFLWLLYPFSRRFHMFDHFVFVTYSISFMLLLLVALRLSSLLPDAVNGPLYAIGIPYAGFHMYRQLRGAYRSSRVGAALRAVLLMIFCNFTVAMFLLLLLAMGIMG